MFGIARSRSSKSARRLTRGRSCFPVVQRESALLCRRIYSPGAGFRKEFSGRERES